MIKRWETYNIWCDKCNRHVEQGATSYEELIAVLLNAGWYLFPNNMGGIKCWCLSCKDAPV